MDTHHWEGTQPKYITAGDPHALLLAAFDTEDRRLGTHRGPKGLRSMQRSFLIRAVFLHSIDLFKSDLYTNYPK